MGVTEGTALVLNITKIEDVISVTVNTVALFIFNYGIYAAALVGVVVLEYVTGVFRRILGAVRKLVSV